MVDNRRVVKTLFVILSEIVLGCNKSESGLALPLVRDSLGVSIVSNPMRESKVPTIGITFDSSITIDGVELLRAKSARWLGPRTGVVFDQASSEVFLFDLPTGRMRRIGDQGDGPGEFRVIGNVYVCGRDSIAVYGLPTRLALFDSAGRFVREHQMALLKRGLHGVTLDCSAVLGVETRRSANGVRDRDILVFALGIMQGNGTSVVAEALSPARGTVLFHGRSVRLPIPFSAFPVWAFRDSLLYLGNGDTPEVRVYNQAGILIRIIRWETKPMPLTQADHDSYERIRSELDERVGKGTKEDFPPLREFDLPTLKPVYNEFLVTEEGQLWVQEYPRIWEGFIRLFGNSLSEGASRWWVFSASGMLVGRVVIPKGVMVTDVRKGMILGVWSDSSDIQHIRLLKLAEGVR